MRYSTKVDDRAFLQQKILRKIATYGRQSVSRLEKDLAHHHPPVYSAVQSLVKKNRLQGVKGIGHENKMGRSENFFDLTGQGILYLINEMKISLEDFWKMAFNVFDQNKTLNISFTVHELFLLYEKNILGFNRECTLSSLYEGFPDIEILSGLRISDAEQKMIEILATLGSIPNDKLIKKLKIKKIKQPPEKLTHPESLFRGVSKDGIIYFELTLIGLQYYIYILLKKLNQNQQTKQISILANNYKNSLPLIFGKWDQLKMMFDVTTLIECLTEAIDNNFRQKPIQTGEGFQEILDAQRCMEEVYHKKLEEHTQVGTRIVSERFQKELDDLKSIYKGKTSVFESEDSFENLGVSEEQSEEWFKDSLKPFLPVVKESNELRRLSGFKEGTPYERESITFEDLLGVYEKIKADSLSFRFYTILSGKAHNKKGKYMVSWNNFLTSEPDIFSWCTSWLKEIYEFEKKNLKFLEDFKDKAVM
jgi:hypothetical protein